MLDVNKTMHVNEKTASRMILKQRDLPGNHLNDQFRINVYGYSVCLAIQTMQTYSY